MFVLKTEMSCVLLFAASLLAISVFGLESNDKKPFCVVSGSGKNVINNEQCINNDTYCGDMDILNRKWNALGCKYRDVSVSQARKCLHKKTISCVGDSQVRDICFGLALFMSNTTTIEMASNKKFDKLGGDFFHIGAHLHHRRGHLFPSPEQALKQDLTYQVQIHDGYLKTHDVEKGFDDIANNNIITYWNILHGEMHHNSSKSGSTNKFQPDSKVLGSHKASYIKNYLRPADIILFNYGLHEMSDTNAMFTEKQKTARVEEIFYDTILTKYLSVHNKAVAAAKDSTDAATNANNVNSPPVVWVSLNHQCLMDLNRTDLPLAKIAVRKQNVEQINTFVHEKFKKEKIPYWDASTILKTPTRCEFATDVIHLSSWVHLIGANVLLNYLCDENDEWVGNSDRFIL